MKESGSCLHQYRKCVLFLMLGTVVFLVFSGHHYNNAKITASFSDGTPILNAQDSTPFVCKQKRHIMFLKTHKCASSSVQNIFMRYGYRHGLTFVLPAYSNYIGHPAKFRRTMVPNSHRFNRDYDIFTHHTRLDAEEIRQLMPRGTIFVTILRDPVDMFESLYSYYDLQAFYRKKIEDLNVSDTLMLQKRRKMYKFGVNQMLFDLGMEAREFNNHSVVHEFVQHLSSIFDLVMVADRMSESLVLLKELLCWDLEDVVTFKTNARDKRFKSSLTPEVRFRIRELNHADVILYNHFSRKFNELVKQFGVDRMSVEVNNLENRTRELYNLCVEKVQLVRTKKKFYSNPKVLGFSKSPNNTNTTCEDLTSHELVFTDKIRSKQKFMFQFQGKTNRRRSYRRRLNNQRRKVPKKN